MLNHLQLFIAMCFCINATLAISFTVNYIFTKRTHDSMDYLVLCITISSTIWSIGMGMMSLQESDITAYIWRTIGIFGTFMFMMSVQKTMCKISEISYKKQKIFNGISYSGLFVFLIYSVPGQTIFVRNSIGTTFYFRPGIINIIYSMYYVFVSANIFLVTLYMLRKHELKQIRIAGKRFVIVELLVFIGALTDMVMPSLGYNALPGSALTHFWGVCVFWFAIHEMYKSKITVANMSEYIYYFLDTPILIFNSDKKLVIANDASFKYFQLDQKALSDNTITIDTLLDCDDMCFSFSDKSTIIKSRCHAQNTSCELAISKINNPYNDIIGYIILINDLSEHELVIQRLEQAKLAADSANMSKSLFLANMSHEIRTPMNAIMGLSQIALNSDIDATTREYFSDIYNSGEILLSIVNTILDISKIELGKQELNPANYKPARIIRDVELITKVHARKKNLGFSMNIDPSLPNVLYGDKDKIREILMNLLNNAVKYTNQGHINLTITSTHTADKNITLELKVSDTGIGIKEEDLSTIFDKFRRLDDNLNSKTEGTGLGLSITKGLVELMNGEITVESTFMVGSTFTVRIPQTVVDSRPVKLITDTTLDDETSKTVSIKNTEEKKNTINGIKILVVDDNEINLNVAHLFLKTQGITSDTANSGKESIEMSKQKTYDIIFMDQMMPEMDGVEAMQLIRKLPEYEKGSPHKIVAFTANVIQGVEQELLSKGFDAYIGKPMDASTLLEIIHKFYTSETL